VAVDVSRVVRARVVGVVRELRTAELLVTDWSSKYAAKFVARSMIRFPLTPVPLRTYERVTTRPALIVEEVVNVSSGPEVRAAVTAREVPESEMRKREMSGAVAESVSLYVRTIEFPGADTDAERREGAVVSIIMFLFAPSEPEAPGVGNVKLALFPAASCTVPATR